MKNLEAIEEFDHTIGQRSRVGAMVMASFGGACIVFAALLLMRSPEPEKVASSDPLGALVDASKRDNPADDERLEQRDVTFPSVLTDQENPTTAMEVVRRQGVAKGPGVDTDELPRAPMVFDGPPPATDRLPVVPLPAQDVVAAFPQGKVAASDKLRTMAQTASRERADGTVAESGAPGGYQLQVSSFKKQGDADAFAMALRRRGHKAYVQQAHVKGRGLWHRVRIGPFRYKRSAKIYRQDFEAKERMVTFVVDPPKTRIHIAPSAGDTP